MEEKKFFPLAFRLRPEERRTLKNLASQWKTSQVGVLRRLLAEAVKREAQDGQK